MSDEKKVNVKEEDFECDECCGSIQEPNSTGASSCGCGSSPKPESVGCGCGSSPKPESVGCGCGSSSAPENKKMESRPESKGCGCGS